MNTFLRPVLGFSGYSGSGKTTIIEKIIKRLKNLGYRVAVIKHDVHDFEMDKEGKDTFRFSEAGADEVFISSGEKSARISSFPRSMEEMISECGHADIVLIEGYKYADIKKIAVTSEKSGYAFPCSGDSLEAVVTDDISQYQGRVSIPVFYRNDVEGITGFIRERYLDNGKD